MRELYPDPKSDWNARLKRFLLDSDARFDNFLFQSGRWAREIWERFSMKAAVLQRILLCLNPAIGQSVQRVYELALLHEEIDSETALRLLAIWQASHPAQKAKPAAYQPQLWRSEREPAALPAPRSKISSDEAHPEAAGRQRLTRA